MFVLLFLSSASMPRDLIEQDWFQTAATINPVSYVIEAFAACSSSAGTARRWRSGSASRSPSSSSRSTAANFAMRERMVRT